MICSALRSEINVYFNDSSSKKESLLLVTSELGKSMIWRNLAQLRITSYINKTVTN